jgi:hypothetical protein
VGDPLAQELPTISKILKENPYLAELLFNL